MTTRWLEAMPLGAIPRALSNPKLHDDRLVALSLEEHGYVAPMVMDERTGRLVAGHGRLDNLEARKAQGLDPPEGVEVDEAGEWVVPVYRGWSSRDDDQAAAYLVMDNRAGEAGWDRPTLADLLGPMAERDALAGSGFERQEVDDLLASLRTPDFQPEPIEDQPRLDQRTPVTCPSCGHTFQRP